MFRLPLLCDQVENHFCRSSMIILFYFILTLVMIRFFFSYCPKPKTLPRVFLKFQRALHMWNNHVLMLLLFFRYLCSLRDGVYCSAVKLYQEVKKKLCKLCCKYKCQEIIGHKIVNGPIFHAYFHVESRIANLAGVGGTTFAAGRRGRAEHFVGGQQGMVGFCV